MNSLFEYLYALKKYALGDLNLFHRLVKEAEEIEVAKGIATSSTTTEFTKNYGEGSYSRYPTNDPVFRATIPFAMMIFSCIDFIGFLIREGGREDQTKKNISAYLTFIEYEISIEDINCLVYIFRHGLSHNYFPKLSQAISYRTNSKDVLFFREENNFRGVLNLRKLEELFLIGINKIMSKEIIESSLPKYELLLERYEAHECKINAIGRNKIKK